MSRRKTAKLLAEHPYCCFCGGSERATTVDHVPPRACFPKGYHPEGLEFPACDGCNFGSSKFDQIVGLFTQLIDFAGVPNDPQKGDTLRKAIVGVLNNNAPALPDFFAAKPIFKIGNIVTPHPVAFEATITPEMKEAVGILCQKLTHALYYKHYGRALKADSTYFTFCYQAQDAQFLPTTEYINKLPHFESSIRKNTPGDVSRFHYKWGIDGEESIFMYGAQFGTGLLVMGTVLMSCKLLSDSIASPIPASAWELGGNVKTSIGRLLAKTVSAP